MQPIQNIGRIVVVAERRLSVASRGALKAILAEFRHSQDATFVAGMGRAAVVSAARDGGNIFYNTNDHLPLWDMMQLMPWREVWVVAGGRAWRAEAVDMAGPLPHACGARAAG